MTIPRVLISAPQRSSGKTTVTIGLGRALTQQGYQVQTFKKGPDFIDPMWHKSSTNRDCYNLDYYMMNEEKIISSFIKRSRESDLSLIEGNMSLYDGYDLEGTGSSAHLARLLKTPVILVVNVTGVNRGIAPLIMGYQQFEPETPIVGVIFNQVRGSRHEQKLRNAVEHYCQIEVLGAMPSESDLTITMRHLGLVPIQEDPNLDPMLDIIGNVVKENVNLNRIVEIAKSAPPLEPKESTIEIPTINIKSKTRIGIAQDRAFHFYYPENLEFLKQQGVDLISINTMTDSHLPDIQGLIIGGGFPEVLMDELEANVSLREDIYTAIENNLPVYAECGGLMYLSRSIQWKDKVKKMVGSLPCDIQVYDKPKGHGYLSLESTGKCEWINGQQELKAHEFHYSEVTNLGDVEFAYKLKRGYGVDGKYDGILYKNVLASYAHIHIYSYKNWNFHFLDFVKKKRYSKI